MCLQKLQMSICSEYESNIFRKYTYLLESYLNDGNSYGTFNFVRCNLADPLYTGRDCCNKISLYFSNLYHISI